MSKYCLYWTFILISIGVIVCLADTKANESNESSRVSLIEAVPLLNMVPSLPTCDCSTASEQQQQQQRPSCRQIAHNEAELALCVSASRTLCLHSCMAQARAEAEGVGGNGCASTCQPGCQRKCFQRFQREQRTISRPVRQYPQSSVECSRVCLQVCVQSAAQCRQICDAACDSTPIDRSAIFIPLLFIPTRDNQYGLEDAIPTTTTQRPAKVRQFLFMQQDGQLVPITSRASTLCISVCMPLCSQQCIDMHLSITGPPAAANGGVGGSLAPVNGIEATTIATTTPALSTTTTTTATTTTTTTTTTTVTTTEVPSTSSAPTSTTITSDAPAATQSTEAASVVQGAVQSATEAALAQVSSLREQLDFTQISKSLGSFALCVSLCMPACHSYCTHRRQLMHSLETADLLASAGIHGSALALAGQSDAPISNVAPSGTKLNSPVTVVIGSSTSPTALAGAANAPGTPTAQAIPVSDEQQRVVPKSCLRPCMPACTEECLSTEQSTSTTTNLPTTSTTSSTSAATTTLPHKEPLQISAETRRELTDDKQQQEASKADQQESVTAERVDEPAPLEENECISICMPQCDEKCIYHALLALRYASTTNSTVPTLSTNQQHPATDVTMDASGQQLGRASSEASQSAHNRANAGAKLLSINPAEAAQSSRSDTYSSIPSDSSSTDESAAAATRRRTCVRNCRDTCLDICTQGKIAPAAPCNISCSIACTRSCALRNARIGDRTIGGRSAEDSVRDARVGEVAAAREPLYGRESDSGALLAAQKSAFAREVIEQMIVEQRDEEERLRKEERLRRVLLKEDEAGSPSETGTIEVERSRGSSSSACKCAREYTVHFNMGSECCDKKRAARRQ